MEDFNDYMVNPLGPPAQQDSFIQALQQLTGLSASQITTGILQTSDGNSQLSVSGNNYTVRDGNNQIRVQMGYISDPGAGSQQGDYGLEVWDSSGNVIFKASGGTGVSVSDITGSSAEFQAFYTGTGPQGGGTQISGNYITTGTLNANLVNVTNLNANNITVNTINGTQISTSTITGGSGGNIAGSTITGSNIAANTITANKLTVTNLSAISANLGTITAGSINGITITGSTITGSTLETSTSGQRVVISGSDNSVDFYTSAGLIGQIFANNTYDFLAISGAPPDTSTPGISLTSIANTGFDPSVSIGGIGVVEIGGLLQLCPDPISESGGGSPGQMYYNTSTNQIRAYINGGWRSISYY